MATKTIWTLLRTGTLGAALAAVCGGAVLAGVIIQTGPDGSVSVVTDSVRVFSGGGDSQVLLDGQSFPSGFTSQSSTSSQSSFSSSQSSQSTSRTAIAIERSSLSRDDYVLLLEGASGTVTANGQAIATLDGDSAQILLDPYLSRTSNTISISGSGPANVRTALVRADAGSRPNLDRFGRVSGGESLYSGQQQSNSGFGSWRVDMEIDLY
ncbi:hypothetical protein [Synechococcus sp. PCC 7336]|uniref:hypothetical protein n=1 Tax=Synechococcus sp. PCC 7336 TaxID=195250 RepID=UPI00034D1B68|nr:hypothetical protein [Synechococcus sp. PCC 7336]